MIGLQSIINGNQWEPLKFMIKEDFPKKEVLILTMFYKVSETKTNLPVYREISFKSKDFSILPKQE